MLKPALIMTIREPWPIAPSSAHQRSALRDVKHHGKPGGRNGRQRHILKPARK
jgi:hypothetical protein